MRTVHRVLAVFLTLLLAPLVLAASVTDAAASNEVVTYEVTLTNTTSGQYLTPPNWAAHNRSVDVFQVGRPASPGVEAVAELGAVPVLAAELQAAIDQAGLGVSGVAGNGPIEPGAVVNFTFDTTENRFSVVSMVICTNDGFGGLDSHRLPRSEGDTRVFYARAFDAGTELNTENRDDVVPAPFCSTPRGAPGGNAQDQPEIDGFGIINRHPTLRGVGDLPDSFDWSGPVMKITVTNNG